MTKYIVSYRSIVPLGPTGEHLAVTIFKHTMNGNFVLYWSIFPLIFDYLLINMFHPTQSKVHFIFQAKEKLVFLDAFVRKKIEIRIT